jgi:hypothetical protein
LPSTGVKRAKETKRAKALVTVVTQLTIVTDAGVAIVRPVGGSGKLAGSVGSPCAGRGGVESGQERVWPPFGNPRRCLKAAKAAKTANVSVTVVTELMLLTHAAAVDPAPGAIGAVAAAWAGEPGPQSSGAVRELTNWWPALWTFALVEGVEPTDNGAERALRLAVLWRKGMFGSGSDGAVGSRSGYLWW